MGRGLPGLGLIGAVTYGFATHGVVDEAQALHRLVPVDVAAVEDDVALHRLRHAFEIRMAELAPLGADDQGVVFNSLSSSSKPKTVVTVFPFRPLTSR